MLNASERLMLLAINTDKNKIGYDAYNVTRYGIKGIVLMELIALKRVKIEHKRIAVVDDCSTGDRILDMVMEKIKASGHPIKIGSWILGYSMLGSSLKAGIMDSLEDNGIIRQEEQRFLGLFPMKRYIVTGMNHRQELASRIKRLTLGDKNAVGYEEACIISILAVCGYLKAILSKDEIKSIKDKIKLIKKGEYFGIEGQGIEEILKGIRNAISSAATASI
ncbi:Golgi phosphoprotein 3 GPP34 [Anaerobacterium chartisolvens]|uniref:Golgi phosphoprotein 3 GPP34 n=1 Tax=Anaerobacterium chartisolvens TaxID=1297424 RepID=A0A369B4R4_9FIRM|nr:GPP34 family phosphoprotein [Anaerobacterium chartisolvens]RCX15547.1 Golgi phosphoprotein 3 GPP34 [Anaerobacterium chartisolvens]